MNEEGIKADSMKLRTMLSTCDHLRIPTLCLVNGGCIGGGVGLCSTAKTVVALPNTWFLFSEVRLGIIPAIVSPFVCNRIGKAQCKWDWWDDVMQTLHDDSRAHRCGGCAANWTGG